MKSIRLGFCSYGNNYGMVQRLAAALLFTVLSVLPSAAQSAAQSERPVKIVALGDSLSAGYGLPGNAAFPVRLAEALKQRGHAVAMTNAGVSGDTATGGLARVDWSVPDGTEAVIVELGANDFLRGIDPAVTLKALDGILAKLKARNMQILLCGFIAGKNMGADYERSFNAIYPALAKKYDAVFFPWFLDQVGGERRLNQADGIHPNAEGVDIIVKNILPYAEELLARVKAARGS